MEKTSIGLAENIAGLLCYVLGWISGLVFLLLEQENKFVRFHAIQSIIVFAIIMIIGLILSAIPFVGTVLAWIVTMVGVVFWIVLMIKAYQGNKYKLPWAGNLAEKWAG